MSTYIKQIVEFLSCMDEDLISPAMAITNGAVTLHTTKPLDSYDYAEVVEWVNEVATNIWGLNSGPHIYVINVKS